MMRGERVFVHVVVFLVGLLLLVKGSDYFVESAASIARGVGVSEFVIGLTLVAVGTSIPELASSVVASLERESGIVTGSVVGSNIANICLIIGIAVAIAAIRTKEEMLRRDGYIMLLASGVFYLFALGGVISGIEATVFLLLYLAYVIFLLEMKPRFKGRYHFKEFIRYFFKFQYLATIKRAVLGSHREGKPSKGEARKLSRSALLRDLSVLILGGMAIVFGAKYLVEEAVFFAETLNIPQTLIGISLVAVGTSLPELSVSVSAARKGYGDIAVGNIIGSNIANIFLILGISGLIFPLSIAESTLLFAAPFMIFTSLLLLIFIKSQWELRRMEGMALLALYVIFMALLFSGLLT